jgi:hypothetical protein
MADGVMIMEIRPMEGGRTGRNSSSKPEFHDHEDFSIAPMDRIT